MAYVSRDTGYWKYSTLQYPGYSCSVCHKKYKLHIVNQYNYEQGMFDFCPACGSKMIEMRGEENDLRKSNTDT